MSDKSVIIEEADMSSAAQAAELYETFRQHLYRTASGILKNSEDAEDAVQQLFADMISKGALPAISDPRTKAYLTVAVRNKALNMLSSRRVSEPLETAKDHSAKAGPSELSGLIEKLPEEKRRILILYYYFGYDTAEIADLTGLRPAAVQKRLQRARQALRKMLEEN